MIDIPVTSIRAAAKRPEVVAAMQAFYEQADREIAEKNATCWNSGECCRFGQYGHRLYVTVLEVAYYLARSEDRSGGPPWPPLSEQTNLSGLSLPIYAPVANETDVCPHSHGGKCHVRDRRPLGCRIFYCDPNAQHWQGPMTEQKLALLRKMHEELGVPYCYADWMAVLRALGEMMSHE